MGTKNNPGLFDCYNAALPDEETFTLLARDPDFAAVVEFWALRRLRRIVKAECPKSDMLRVEEAESSAAEGARWRAENMGKWRPGYTPKPQ